MNADETVKVEQVDRALTADLYRHFGDANVQHILDGIEDDGKVVQLVASHRLEALSAASPGVWFKHCEVCEFPEKCRTGQTTCDLTSEFVSATVPGQVANKLLRALNTAGPGGGEAAAWMRLWAFEKNEGTKWSRPKGWKFQAVTSAKLFDTDIPLYFAPPPTDRPANGEVEEALKPFADLADWLDENRAPRWSNPAEEFQCGDFPYSISIGQLHAARDVLAALSQRPADGGDSPVAAAGEDIGAIADAVANALASVGVAYTHSTITDLQTVGRSWNVHDVVEGENPFHRGEWLGKFDNKLEAHAFAAKLRRERAVAALSTLKDKQGEAR